MIKRADCHYYVTISNHSNHGVYYYFQANYPDTSIGTYNPAGSPYNYQILANSEKQATIGRNDCLEGKFQQYSTWELFLFDENTLLTVPWDTIRKKYLILKRYDLTLKDLQNANWSITYP